MRFSFTVVIKNRYLDHERVVFPYVVQSAFELADAIRIVKAYVAREFSDYNIVSITEEKKGR